MIFYLARPITAVPCMTPLLVWLDWFNILVTLPKRHLISLSDEIHSESLVLCACVWKRERHFLKYILLILYVLFVGERVIVVTHGGFIRQLYNRACPNGGPCGKVLNTSVSVFHLDADDKWIIKMWSDVSHLSQTGFLQSGFGGDKNSG